MIIGRQKEIALFKKLLSSSKPEFLAIYGRRRVGKTFLVREYFQEQLTFDFSGAYQGKTETQIFNFYTQLQRYNSSFQNLPTPKNWSEAFNILTDYLLEVTANSSEKVVVFIDELPWLDQPNSGFIAAFEYFWNQHGSKIRNLLLITCGSAASWIIKKLINAKGGLYNRLTANLELKPFTLSETKEFFAYKNLQFTNYQIVQLYMVMGGIPFYLEAIPRGKSVTQVIDELCFVSGGLLSSEFNPLYHSLFKNAENHIQIISVLANRPYGLTRKNLELLTPDVNGGTLSRALENLINCGFVVTQQAFGKKKKETTYRVIDFYSIFYHKYIHNNTSTRQNVWQNLSQLKGYNQWQGYAFENIAISHLDQIHDAMGISGIYTESTSWRLRGDSEIEGTQVDLIIDRSDGIINLCEVKFTSQEYLLTKDYTKKLRNRRALFANHTQTKKTIVTTLISSYPAIQNEYYFEEIHSEISMDELF